MKLFILIKKKKKLSQITIWMKSAIPFFRYGSFFLSECLHYTTAHGFSLNCIMSNGFESFHKDIMTIHPATWGIGQYWLGVLVEPHARPWRTLGCAFDNPSSFLPYSPWWDILISLAPSPQGGIRTPHPLDWPTIWWWNQQRAEPFKLHSSHCQSMRRSAQVSTFVCLNQNPIGCGGTFPTQFSLSQHSAAAQADALDSSLGY